MIKRFRTFAHRTLGSDFWLMSMMATVAVIANYETASASADAVFFMQHGEQGTNPNPQASGLVVAHGTDGTDGGDSSSGGLLVVMQHPAPARNTAGHAAATD